MEIFKQLLNDGWTCHIHKIQSSGEFRIVLGKQVFSTYVLVLNETYPEDVDLESAMLKLVAEGELIIMETQNSFV